MLHVYCSGTPYEVSAMLQIAVEYSTNNTKLRSATNMARKRKRKSKVA